MKNLWKEETPHHLYVAQSVKVFCENKDHYNNKCDVIMEVSLRRAKSKELNCCFKRLKKG